MRWFFLFLQFSYTASQLNFQTFYYTKQLVLHFEGASNDVGITKFVRETEYIELSKVPYGNIEDIIGYASDYRCFLNILRQRNCDEGLHEFSGKLGPNPVFRRFDESDYLNSNCLGSYMQCVALWVKPDVKFLKYLSLESTCYLYISLRGGKPTRYRSGDTINNGYVTITFYFDCPPSERFALANDTHLFIGTNELTVDITHGYLSRFGDTWKPNANLQVKPLGNLNIELFSDFSYNFVLPNPFLKTQYSSMPLIGLINYITDSDIPVMEIEHLPPCYTKMSWSVGYHAETHEPSFVVYALKNDTVYDHTTNCTLHCVYSDSKKNHHYFNMINGIAHVHMQGIVLCDTGRFAISI